MLRFSPCLPRSLFSLVFCLSSIVFSAARAADFDAERMEPEPEWAVIVSPYVWAASLKGNASLAGFDTDVDVPFSEIFDHLDLALMGNVEVTNGKWGVFFDGQHVQTSQDERVFAHEIGIDIKTTTLAAGAFFKAYEVELGGQTVFGKPRTISFEPTVGVRWTELKADVSAFGVSSTKSSDWADPFIGLRMNAASPTVGTCLPRLTSAVSMSAQRSASMRRRISGTGWRCSASRRSCVQAIVCCIRTMRTTISPARTSFAGMSVNMGRSSASRCASSSVQNNEWSSG